MTTYNEPGVTYNDPCYLYNGTNICTVVVSRPRIEIGGSSSSKKYEQEQLKGKEYGKATIKFTMEEFSSKFIFYLFKKENRKSKLKQFYYKKKRLQKTIRLVNLTVNAKETIEIILNTIKQT